MQLERLNTDYEKAVKQNKENNGLYYNKNSQ